VNSPGGFALSPTGTHHGHTSEKCSEGKAFPTDLGSVIRSFGVEIRLPAVLGPVGHHG
jgi:hypothetical protein